MKLALYLLLLGCSTGTGASHYIRAGATGSGDGTSWVNAWTNFDVVTWTRGYTYYLAGGSYGTNATLSKANAGELWITIRKANAANNAGDAGWDAAYATTPALVNGRISIDSGYWEIDGVTGSGEAGHGIKFQDLAMQGVGTLLYSGIGPLHLYHLEVRNGLYKAPTGIDVIWGGATTNKGIAISYCWLHDCSKDGVSFNNLQGQSWSDYGLVFENNVLSETGGALNGDHGQGMKFAGDCSYLIFRNNVFRNSSGTAVVAFLGIDYTFSNVRFYNNLFYKDNLAEFPSISPGIIYGRDTVTCSNFFIANNSFFGFGNPSNSSTVAQIALDGTNANNAGNSLVNNVWENSYFTSGGHHTFSTNANNAYHGITGSAVAMVTSNQITGSATAFVAADARNFRLKAGSYPIGAAMNLQDYFTTDATGITRTGTWDIGAYEYVDPSVGTGTFNTVRFGP